MTIIIHPVAQLGTASHAEIEASMSVKLGLAVRKSDKQGL